jgi:N6-adenosine-specific RNA methylase IME4
MSTSYVQPDIFGHGTVREWPFGRLEPQSFSLLMADPPWRFLTRSDKGLGKSPDAHYRTMGLSDIASLPVADLATEDALLWLWCTAPMLDVQIDVMKRWGFTFKSSGVWVKTTPTGKLAFGTGYLLRNCSEIYVIGTRGSPETVSKSVRSAILAPVREHSRKPEQAYENARALIPYGRAVELFSRTSRPGWSCWGDEAGKFDEAAA